MDKKPVESTPLLEVKNLQTAFSINDSWHNAVDDVSFQVGRKRIVGVVGESGCGKSVLSLSVIGLLPKVNSQIRSGSVLFKGKNLTHLSEDEMNDVRGKDISMIFQEPMTSLNPVLTIGYQLQEVLFNHMNISKAEAREKSIALLKSVGISRSEKLVDEYPHQLSGGMRQRVMIAMAVACQPKLLIADEPTTALDVTVQAQILELLKEIQESNDMSIIMITHDLGVVAEMCDEVIVMYGGKIVEHTDVDTLFYAPKHPYTKALLHSIPRMEDDVEVLNTIKGIVPSLVNMPRTGCRFVNRCPHAMEDCSSVTPVLRQDSQGHDVACLLYKNSYPSKGVKTS
ncbi:MULTISPECIES: ABC transporter ATP-binding protein [Priestia]|jgi:peptide/nickel transport system ATP-binding protein|uniref:Oligopeptide ABC transporter, ATP-binding protein AppD n=5 Tax=Priestia TaxID=2800373 RepID=D5E012_PRIM1|nr:MULTISPECIES: ABC transporter ATP-binding protein [Priestia]AVX06844.1 ABC transporter ATP-binding protein [Bacillus sp. Y-01]KOP73042.1 peptide ABC transporter ATP-binding protein [Bacillus sp. FJAT-21351]KQU26036.1 peptide ABC transporter ATP-binding protein [Bacillus sp. Leaf75]KRF52657.1 peptide ABC transporter ATP-binding protein [Bacillus sp. Soil531]MBZ5479760.1 ABC transporter ATP-binding protein [Bacillus sp. T_4]MCF6794558.1 ABC transporter ATP-binding protein [Bacillus sp. ET1]